MSATDTIPEVERLPLAALPRLPVTRKSRFGSLLIGGILVVLGALWTLDLAGVMDVRPELILPAILIVIGLALIIGSADGPHRGLVFAGLVLSVVVAVAAFVPFGYLGAGNGDRIFRVTEEGNLGSEYQIGFGELRLDLSELDLTRSADVAVSLGAGNMIIVLPPSVAVEVHASIVAGEIDLLGQRIDGVSVSRSYRSEGVGSAPVVLTLDLDAAAGSIEVTR